MNHRLLGGFTAALLMSAFGAPLPSFAEDASESQALANPSTGTQSAAVQAALEGGIHPLGEVVSVYAHLLDGATAVTLYVNTLPVVTFVGEASAESSPVADAKAALDPSDPMARAWVVGSELERFAAANQDATTIGVRWDSDQERYVVSLADQDLLAVGTTTILADTTADEAEDALQITNRLRRLLGDAPALDEIEGQPAPLLAVASTQTGLASWYGPGFHGRRSASGEVFNQYALTAAHRTLPFGTRVRVTNLNTGQQVVVRINDRGPFSGRRIIDLSAEAAAVIGLRSSGVGEVRLEILAD